MNSKEFLNAVDFIVKEKNIDPEIVFDGEDLHDVKSQFEYVVDNYVLNESD